MTLGGTPRPWEENSMRKRLSINAIYARAVAYREHPNGRRAYRDLGEWELDRFWTFVRAMDRLAARA